MLQHATWAASWAYLHCPASSLQDTIQSTLRVIISRHLYGLLTLFLRQGKRDMLVINNKGAAEVVWLHESVSWACLLLYTQMWYIEQQSKLCIMHSPQDVWLLAPLGQFSLWILWLRRLEHNPNRFAWQLKQVQGSSAKRENLMLQICCTGCKLQYIARTEFMIGNTQQH